jgi:hypothetical protein
VDWAWSAGVQWRRNLLGRRFTLAGAYGKAGTADDTEEDTAEVYGSWQVNTWTFASLHLQSVEHVGVLAGRTTLVGGRIQFNF